ncbi:MAG: hypothetical protein HW412_2057, partial [Bacteroidetes bacterium]|nr:hypothetical protein [Bacteroidota bacterium]
SNQLPKATAPSKDPVEVSLGQPVVVGNETRIPVEVGGNVTDIRGMKLEISGQFSAFLGVEKGTLLQSYTNPVMLLGRADGRIVHVDFAIAGLDVDGIKESGDVVWLRFAGTPHVKLNSVEGRTSQNAALNAAKKRGAGESVPMSFNLMQNYSIQPDDNDRVRVAYHRPRNGRSLQHSWREGRDIGQQCSGSRLLPGPVEWKG